MAKIISLLIMTFFSFSCTCTSYEKELSDILGIADVKYKLIYSESEYWNFEVEVYELSEDNISDFINKSKKVLSDRPNLNKRNWSKIPLDSSSIENCNLESLIHLRGGKKFNQTFDEIEELYKNKSYYSMYYSDNFQYTIIFILDQINRKIYIKSYQD